MITTIITDFDGTLVDTFEANLRAYQHAFADNGLCLTAEEYRQRFGFRFERFMTSMGITDENTANAIKEAKKYYYPQFFEYMKPNKPLIELLSSFKSLGGKTAIASTARKENLINVVDYLSIEGVFNSIFAVALDLIVDVVLFIIELCSKNLVISQSICGLFTHSFSRRRPDTFMHALS